MSVLPMPPAPRGSTEEQLSRQYAYLFQMAQQLTLALAGLGGGQGGLSAAAAAAASDGGGRTAVTEEEKAQYRNLKSLIIRTAAQIDGGLCHCGA